MPRTRIVSLFNQAGGMAKTTITANVGYHLHALGNRVLVIDMDGQASLTRYTGHDPTTLKESVYDALIHDKPMPILKDWYGVDVVPSKVDVSSIERQLHQEDQSQLRLKKRINSMGKDYDFILIDCPPKLDLLRVMSLMASTHTLIPITTNCKGMEGTKDLSDTLKIARMSNQGLRIAGAIPTKFNARTTHDRGYLKVIQSAFGKFHVYQPIPLATDIDNAWEARKPVAKYSPKHTTIKSFEEISKHLETLP